MPWMTRVRVRSAAMPNWTTGKVGGALNFDGQTYVDLGSLGQLEATDSFSMAAWVYPTSSEAIAIVSKMDDANAYRGYDLLLEGGKVVVPSDPSLARRRPEGARQKGVDAQCLASRRRDL